MKTINVSEETYEKIKSQLLPGEDYIVDQLGNMVGKNFFFRTVTYHLVGRVEKIMGSFLELSDASWVADSGRFMDAIKDGKLKEVEPVGQGWINLSATTDFFPWKHSLPNEQK